MNPKKTHYRRKMPHFHEPGKCYSVTFTLKGAMPKSAMAKYDLTLQSARAKLQTIKKSHSSNPKILTQVQKELQIAQRKYSLAFDKILSRSDLLRINLSKKENRELLEKALQFYEGKRFISHAWCIMPNHVHWVLTVNEKDENGNPVYLQDILHSVKLFTARRINQNENHNGHLWEDESYETTINNHRHFVNVVNYVLNNPVKAGFVRCWEDWPGSQKFRTPAFLSR